VRKRPSLLSPPPHSEMRSDHHSAVCSPGCARTRRTDVAEKLPLLPGGLSLARGSHRPALSPLTVPLGARCRRQHSEALLCSATPPPITSVCRVEVITWLIMEQLLLSNGSMVILWPPQTLNKCAAIQDLHFVRGPYSNVISRFSHLQICGRRPRAWRESKLIGGHRRS
jgi:hypothetical protein